MHITFISRDTNYLVATKLMIIKTTKNRKFHDRLEKQISSSLVEKVCTKLFALLCFTSVFLEFKYLKLKSGVSGIPNNVHIDKCH